MSRRVPGKQPLEPLTEAPDGYRITPYNPDFEDKMAKAEDIIGRYRNTLRVLAQ